jgi:hypothetical protein
MWNWDGMPPASDVPRAGYRFSEVEHRKAAEHVRDNHPDIFAWVSLHPDELPREPEMQIALSIAIEEALPGYLGLDQIYARHMVMTLANPPSIEEIRKSEEAKQKHRRFRQSRNN